MKKNHNNEWIEEIKKINKAADIELLELISDGILSLRLCKIDSCKSRWGSRPIFTFVTVSGPWSVTGEISDVGFFYRSSHMTKWQIVPIGSWMKQYKSLGDFLKDYPETKEIFREYPMIPGWRSKIEFSEGGEKKVMVGYAGYDGDHVRIFEDEEKYITLEPWMIDSISKVEDEDATEG